MKSLFEKSKGASGLVFVTLFLAFNCTNLQLKRNPPKVVQKRCQETKLWIAFVQYVIPEISRKFYI